MDYSELKKSILQEILQGKTTSQMSQSLGFKFDKYKRWLNNDKILRWDEFEFLCANQGINLPHALGAVIPSSLHGPKKNIFALLKDWNLFKSNKSVSEYLKCHISVIKRYNTQETIPDVETVFKLIGKKTGQLGIFINELFSYKIEGLKLKQLIGAGQGNDLILKNPLIMIIDSALQLEAYNQKITSTDAWLADLLDISQKEVNHLLEQMLSMEIIEKDKDIYKSTYKFSQTDGLTYQENIPKLQYAASKYLELLNLRKDPNYKPDGFPEVGHMLFLTLNRDNIAKINNILVNAYNEIHQISLMDKGVKTEIRIVQVQSFSLF